MHACVLQVISWWGPTWREGTHDTQGVNTDAVLGTVLRELEQQDTLKLAFHMEPYEGAWLQPFANRGLCQMPTGIIHNGYR